MAIDRIKRVVAPRESIARGTSKSTALPRAKRRRPIIVLVRSLAMVALAGLGILVVLPAAIAAQAASAI